MTRCLHPLRPALLLASALLAACASLPDADLVAIGAVQGRDARSAREGQAVVVEGTVTAVAVDGWYLQDAGDGDDATSDALFVRTREVFAPGDRARVRGTVAEIAVGRTTRTAITDAKVERIGTALPPTVAIDDAPADWERLEGMSVRIDAPLVLIDHENPGRDDRVQVAFGARPWQPTERATPGSDAARAIAQDNARRTLRVQAATWPAGLGQARAGSHLDKLAGVIDEGEAGVTLRLDATPTLLQASRPAPPTVTGDLRVAALNLENLFNGDGRGGGFPTKRGARTPQELQAQLAKHVAMIRGLDADVIALMELENDGYGPESSIAALVSALGGTWRFVDAGEGPGDNAIRVGLVYRGDRVRALGKPATLAGGPFGPESRVPLAQAFVPLTKGRVDGVAFVVVANHFKSKGCSNASGADKDQRDGASCYNATRVESARRLDEWLRAHAQAAFPGREPLMLVVGDLNAYAHEAPVRTLVEAGWRDAFEVAGIAEPYSYVWDARVGRLDHALLSPALAARLRGAAEWHANADEPEASGYQAGGEGPWRSSDHDPLLLGFDLRGTR